MLGSPFKMVTKIRLLNQRWPILRRVFPLCQTVSPVAFASLRDFSWLASANFPSQKLRTCFCFCHSIRSSLVGTTLAVTPSGAFATAASPHGLCTRFGGFSSPSTNTNHIAPRLPVWPHTWQVCMGLFSYIKKTIPCIPLSKIFCFALLSSSGKVRTLRQWSFLSKSLHDLRALLPFGSRFCRRRDNFFTTGFPEGYRRVMITSPRLLTWYVICFFTSFPTGLLFFVYFQELMYFVPISADFYVWLQIGLYRDEICYVDLSVGYYSEIHYFVKRFWHFLFIKTYKPLFIAIF